MDLRDYIIKKGLEEVKLEVVRSAIANDKSLIDQQKVKWIKIINEYAKQKERMDFIQFLLTGKW